MSTGRLNTLVLQLTGTPKFDRSVTGPDDMYDLPYHKERNAQVIHDFIADHPFALLSGCDADGKPVVTQVPVFLEERDGRLFLSGHLMKETDHHRAFLHNHNALVVFNGPHVYVSGTWYSEPHTPSTWNYMSVHARGTIRFLEGAALEDMLKKTSLHFEGGDHHSPTAFQNLPRRLTERLVSAIVAFEIEIEAMDNVFKLSQDRDAPSYLNIIERLKEQGEDGLAIAAEMQKRMSQLFPQEHSRRDI